MHVAKNKTHESKVLYTYNNDARIDQSISRHSLNRSISITYPSSNSNGIALPEAEDYLIATLTLSQILQPVLLDLISSEKIILFSLNNVDTENAFCLIDGQLTLSLTKESYQRAGLEGKISKLTSGKWNVVFDLTQAGLDKSKQFRRLQHSVNTILIERFKVVSDLGNPSILSGLNCLDSCDIFPLQRTQWKSDCLIPDFLCDSEGMLDLSPDKESFFETQEDVLTHLALLSIPQTIDVDQDPYISNYGCPAPYRSQEVTNLGLSGFLSSQYIKSILNTLRKSSLAWFSVQIKGFENVTHAWLGAEHGASFAGENCITILARSGRTDDAQPNKNLVMWEILGARDSYA